MMKKLAAAAALALATMVNGPAHAAVVYAFQEVGTDVIGTLSGTLDTTGLVNVGTLVLEGGKIAPSAGELQSGPDGNGSYFGTPLVFATFGTGGFQSADATSGDIFWIKRTELMLPETWVSGSSLSGSMTFLNTDFATMGITPGSTVYTLPNDTITLSFQTATIPLPPALPALGAALLGLGWVARRRRG